MKINEEKIKKMADQVKIELTPEEVTQIGESIELITDKLNDIFKEDTTGLDSTRTSTEQMQFSNDETIENEASVDLENLNNNKEGFVVIEKEKNDN